MRTIFAGAALALALLSVPALADTTLSVGQLAAPWLNLVNDTLVGIAGVFVSFVAAKALQWFGVSLSNSARDALQTAITQAAGKVIMLAGDKLNGITFDVRHEFIADAIRYVNAAVPDALKKFGLSDEDIAEKIIAKLGVLTAANPGATPKAT